MTRIEITTKEYPPEMYRRGFPYRITGADFSLKSACRSIRLSETNVIGAQRQEENYRIAHQDDAGWLMYVLSESTLDQAKHIAGNIMRRYLERELGAQWVCDISTFKWKPDVHLFVFDSLFDDDTAYRRSLFYDAIMKVDSPAISVILLGRTDNPVKFMKHIGLRPNLMINTK